MKKITLLSFALIGLFFASCTEQQVMVPEFELPDSERVVLLEELTGASCPNCPQGTAEIENIMSLYGENVIPVAIHGSFLSWPTSESKYDFRNEDAENLEEYLKEWGGKPAAAINRIKYSDELSNSNPPEWSGLIDKELEKEHVLSVEIINSFDPISRKLTMTISLAALVDLGEGNRLTVMILENNIEDAQEDPTTIIEDYEFNHVLRDVITEFDGDPIQKDMKAGEVTNINITYVVPTDDDLWVAENLDIVAFVNRDDAGEKSVLQAAHKKMIE